MLHFQLQRGSAEPLLQRSLRIYETSSVEPLRLAATFRNAARVYLAMGDYAKAEPLLQRSLQICEAQPKNQHRDLADAVNDLAFYFFETDNFVAAEKHWLRCREIKEANHPRDHAEVGLALQNLGALYMKMGQLSRAKPLCLGITCASWRRPKAPIVCQLPHALEQSCRVPV